MEHLPVEIIGIILSRLDDARDMTIASATCRKWREAFPKHLYSLSFDSDNWPAYCHVSTSQLQVLITQTILQTMGLRELAVCMDHVAGKFSASTVLAWLMHTRGSLRKLRYDIRTDNFNIRHISRITNLEWLDLAHNAIHGVDLNRHRFICLHYLSLCQVSISPSDLNLLLATCPKIEIFNLVNPVFVDKNAVELSSPSLKKIYVETICIDRFALAADSLEVLHLKSCEVCSFELIRHKTLKYLKVESTTVYYIHIGENCENLEEIDASKSSFDQWADIYDVFSRSSNLRVLRLWDVSFGDDQFQYVRNIALCCPKLRSLSLFYHLGFSHGLQGCYLLERVVLLEVGWHCFHPHFTRWLEELLEHFPNLEKLVIHGTVPRITMNQGHCQVLADFTSSIVRLMRKYLHVELQVDLGEDDDIAV